MKFDKETIIAIVVCVVLMFAWTPICQYMGWMPPADTAGQEQKTEPLPEKSGHSEKKAVQSTPKPPEQEKTASKPASGIVPKVTKIKNLGSKDIESKELKISIDVNSGAINSVTMKEFLDSDKKMNLVLDKNISPGALAFEFSEPYTLLDAKILSHDPTMLEIRRLIELRGTKISVTQQWSIAKIPYSIDYRITLAPSDDLNLKRFSVFSGGIEPFTRLAGDKIRSESHVIVAMSMDGKFISIKADADEPKFMCSEPALKWTGVSNKYFASLLLPRENFTGGIICHRDLHGKLKADGSIDKDESFYSISSGGVFSDLSIAAKAKRSFDFRYYCGPKELPLLTAFDPSCEEVMDIAWEPINFLSLLMLKALIWLKGLCGSYGLSIILLTLIVRGIFWPITHKGNESMKKMQKIQPKVQELRKQYKDNPQLMNTKMMELYRQEKVNPVSGCLPMLLQIPVFIALYWALESAVELRQVSFLWAQDLSKPDTVATVFGLAINPLVIAMTALMVFQQKITPSAMDPAQQKMMMFMPLVMLVVLYTLPSGLTLYWTVSQIISILQLLHNRMLTKQQEARKAKSA